MKLVATAIVIVAIVIGDYVHADPPNPVLPPLRGPAAVPSYSPLDLFVIKFEEVGYDNVPASIKEPNEKRFRSVTVLTGINSRFSRRVIDLRDKIKIRGTLKLAPEGFFFVELTHEVMSQTDDATFEPRSVASTTINLELDQRACIGGLFTKVNTAEGEMHSKRLLTVTISKLDSLW